MLEKLKLLKMEILTFVVIGVVVLVILYIYKSNEERVNHTRKWTGYTFKHTIILYNDNTNYLLAYDMITDSKTHGNTTV